MNAMNPNKRRLVHHRPVLGFAALTANLLGLACKGIQRSR